MGTLLPLLFAVGLLLRLAHHMVIQVAVMLTLPQAVRGTQEPIAQQLSLMKLLAMHSQVVAGLLLVVVLSQMRAHVSLNQVVHGTHQAAQLSMGTKHHVNQHLVVPGILGQIRVPVSMQRHALGFTQLVHAMASLDRLAVERLPVHLLQVLDHAPLNLDVAG